MVDAEIETKNLPKNFFLQKARWCKSTTRTTAKSATDMFIHNSQFHESRVHDSLQVHFQKNQNKKLHNLLKEL